MKLMIHASGTPRQFVRETEARDARDERSASSASPKTIHCDRRMMLAIKCVVATLELLHRHDVPD